MPDDDDMQRIVEVSIAGGGRDECLVTSMQGEESLAGLYQFWVEVVVMQGAAPKLESDISLILKYSETTGGGRQSLKERTIKGFIASIMQLPHDMRDRTHPRRRLRLLVVPPMWWATMGRRSLSYSEMKVSEVVKQLVGEHGCSAKVSVSGEAAIPCLIQYGESDWDFIARHCEAMGYGHWVDDDGAFNMALVEGGTGGEAIVFRDEESEDARFDWLAHANVFSFTERSRLAVADVTQHSFDVTKAEVVASTGKVVKKSNKVRQDLVFPGGAMDASRAGFESDAAARAIDGRAVMYAGSSDARSFCPGHIFDLSGHEEVRLNDGYTIVRLRHELVQEFSPGDGGMISARYRNLFDCIGNGQKWAPERVTPQPAPQGMVTGKIFSIDDPDSLGRYQVDFMSATAVTITTGWIRALQRFAEVEAGDQVPLAVGTEVMLTFANGDIDQPVIVGTLHNGKNKIPATTTYGEDDTEFNLAKERAADHLAICAGETAKRQQLVLAQTDKKAFVSLRGAAKQELLLDSLDGSERVVLNDGTREHWLEFDQKNQVSRFGSGTKADVKKNQALVCDEKNKKLTLHTGDDDDMLIEAGKDQTVTVAGNHTETITGDSAVTIEGGLTIETTGDHSNKAANHTVEGESKITLKVGSATAVIESSAVTVTLGGSSVKIDNAGVTVKGTNVTVEATGSATVKGASISVKASASCAVESSGTCTVKGSMLTVEGSAMCSVKGGAVMLG